MRLLYYLTVLLITCNIARADTSDKLQCRDESNRPVDWYVLYKLPKIQTSSDPLIRKGLAYLYITSETTETGWRLSTRSISANNSIPGITLAPLYDNENESRYLWNMYNDSPPDAPDASKYGHSKGVVMTNNNQGFWLIHSVPNFPPAPRTGTVTRPLNKENITLLGNYDYPESGTFYGQSFMCIAVGSDEFDTVGKQLMYNEIVVYAKNIPEALGESYPVLRNATNQKRIRKAPFNHKTVIKSLGGINFTSFAKSGKWQKELYSDFVAPQLQSNLYVQSWLNGRGKLPSSCSRRKVYNVKSLEFKIVQVDYLSSHDHSKWAISVDKKKAGSWVCVGDINRADTQFVRGGGTVCLQNALLWNNYRAVVNDVQKCDD